MVLLPLRLFIILLPLSGAFFSDIFHATKHKQSEIHSILPAAFKHDLDRSAEEDNHLLLTCAAYSDGELLRAYLTDQGLKDDMHPAYMSSKEDRVCFTHFGKYPTEGTNSQFVTTMIPGALKIDETVLELARGDVDPSQCTEFVMEVAVGLGVQGKGLTGKDLSNIGSELMQSTHMASTNSNQMTKHHRDFFWTNSEHSAVDKLDAHPNLRSRRDMFSSALTAHQCDFRQYKVTTLRSHVSIASPSCAGETAVTSPSLRRSASSPASSGADCMLLLAAIAAMHSDVSHVTAHRPESSAASRSEDYSVGSPATDQNSWIQIGSRNISDGSSPTPYSDVGLDGTNLVLGMIDSGIDDLSCFMIDYSGTPTDRTPADQYMNPITEPDRRKCVL
jgi:hypothetical protein